jgi:hypothetical protein
VTRREQLIEEAARLRRLQASRRGDLAWARFTAGITQLELERRSLDITELQHRAEALEREATSIPEDRAELPELSLALARQRAVLVSRAGDLRRRSGRCRWLASRETALGASVRAGRLEAEASRLDAEAQHLDLEASMLPATLLAGSDGPPAGARVDRRRGKVLQWPGPERRRALASMPPWWLAAAPG